MAPFWKCHHTFHDGNSYPNARVRVKVANECSLVKGSPPKNRSSRATDGRGSVEPRCFHRKVLSPCCRGLRENLSSGMRRRAPAVKARKSRR
jgi:hypothetical protein